MTLPLALLTSFATSAFAASPPAGSAIAHPALAAAAQELLKNVNQVPNSGSDTGSSNPAEFTVAGGQVLFGAETPTEGRELWRMPVGGGAATLLADLWPGDADGDPSELLAIAGDRVVFAATSPGAGREAWVSDGTAIGTALLADVLAGPDSSEPFRFTEHQGDGYFYVRNAQQSTLELWRTDGTPGGTAVAVDLGPIAGFDPEFQLMASAQGALFLLTYDEVGASGTWRLYASDGTQAGTTLVRAQGVPAPGGPRELTAAGARVAFVAQEKVPGALLWLSDGTPAGTATLQLAPGASAPFIGQLTPVGSEVYLIADSPTGREIFRTDGTALGTQAVTDLPGAAPQSLELLAGANGLLFFTANQAPFGVELFATDGSFGGEFLYAEFAPGGSNGNPTQVLPFGSGIVCRARSPQTGLELFVSDGTPAGTQLVADLQPGAGGSTALELATDGSTLYFSATTPITGREPWYSDGTAAGTASAGNLVQNLADGSSFPREFTALGDRCVFVASNGMSGAALWISDGTAAGTTLLADPDPSQGSFGIADLVELDGRVFFTVDNGSTGDELWSTDGTPAGTALFVDAQPGPQSSLARAFGTFKGQLIFRAAVFSPFFQTFVTDGTLAGTQMLANTAINSPQPGTADVALFVEEDQVWFTAFDFQNGNDLWVSDGTPEGTRVVNVGPGGMDGVLTLDAARLGDFLYFRGRGTSGAFEEELWRTDGTEAGTQLVADVAPGAASSRPSNLQAVGDRVVFHADAGGGRQLFSTDGTILEQLTFPPFEFFPVTRVLPAGDVAITFSPSPEGELLVLRTDGTLAGTQVVTAVGPNLQGVFPVGEAWKVSDGSAVLFNASVDGLAEELWVTDGTEAGTQRLTDLAPGLGFSQVNSVARAGTRIFFEGFEPGTGFEPYCLPLSAFDGWVAQSYGAGCSGSSGVAPTIAASGEATLGSVLTVLIGDSLPGSTVVHTIGLGYERNDLGGCVIHVANPQIFAIGSTDGAGESVLPVAIPPIPILAGLGFWLQSAVADPGGALSGAASVTPALEVVVGS